MRFSQQERAKANSEVVLLEASMRRIIRILVVAAVAADLLGCRSEPIAGPPPLRTSSLDVLAPDAANLVKQARDLAPLDVDLPESLPLWMTNDSALVSGVRTSKGVVFIGLKAPNSPRIIESVRLMPSEKSPGAFVPTGVRGALPAGVIREGVAALQAQGVTILDYYDGLGILLATIIPEFAPALRSGPFVDHVSPNAPSATLGSPRMLHANHLMAQVHPWGIDSVRAPGAWALTTGGGAKLLIIDDGYLRTHEDLPSLPDGNCLGAQGGCDPLDLRRYHGTHIAGIIAARDNTIGVVGVAPGVNAGDISSWGACIQLGFCYRPDIIAGLNWAASNLAHGVVNMSFGRTDYSMDECMAVANAWNSDIVLVAGVGNSGIRETEYPAGCDKVVAVSGILQNKSFASTDPCGIGSGSSYGSIVRLTAPFEAYSTDRTTGGYVTRCGTSFSTAYVSGAALLVRAYHPTWVSTQIIEQLEFYAEHLGTAGINEYTGYGLVRADLAAGLWAPRNLVPSVVAGKPRISWESIPKANHYDIYRRVTMTIHPLWAYCASTTATDFTDDQSRVSGFAWINDPPPAYPTTAVGYYIKAVSSDGVETGFANNANFYAIGSPPPVC